MASPLRRRRPRCHLAGFTLIELLVAISVLAVVAVLGWRGLDGIVRARLALNAQLAQTRGMQLAFAQLQSDCAQLAPAALISNRTPLLVTQDRLLLVRKVYADDQPSRVQVVGYRLRNGILTRQESASTRTLSELDGLWQAAQTDSIATPAITLQSGLAAMTIRVWAADRPGWRAIDATLANPGPASAEANAAPMLTGLEVALQLRDQQSRMLKVFLLGAV
jgi:general secretion pathway protein J